MNRWSTTASDDAAAPPQAAATGGWSRAHAAPAAGFAAPLERPATIPSAAKPDPRRTLNLETEPGRFDLVIEGLLVALLLFMPAALGVIAPWSEMVVVCGAAAIAVCLALKTLLARNAEGRRIVWSWAYVPLVLFVLLAVAQVVPLPTSLVKTVSPATVELRNRLLADAPASQDRMPLNFYPQGAMRELRLVLVAAVMFVAVVNTFHRKAQVKRLLAAVAAIGGLYGGIALLQDVTGADQIFWSIPTFGRAQSGPFVNHNHYGQFINLSIGAALGLLLVRLHEELPRRLSPAQVFDRLQDPELRAVWWLGGVILVGAVTLFVSLTRGGMMGMLAAAAFTALMLALRRGLRGVGWVLSLLGLFVFIALLYVGFDAVAERVGTLHQASDPTSGRMQIYKDVAVSWRKFPVAGMGLGSWEYTYPMFDRSKSAEVAEFADSDYAQALHETGAVGLGLALLFAAIIWGSYGRATGASRVPLCAAAFGLGYGLLAVMVQSATDYGQHMPAIAGLTAVTCGLLVCLGRYAKTAVGLEHEHAKRAVSRGEESLATDELPARARRPRRGWVAFPAALGRLVLPSALMAGMAWAIVSVNAARIADGHWQRAQSVASTLEADGWEGSNEDFTSLLMDTDAATQRQPGNVLYKYWLNAYRWRAISRVTDPDTGALVLTDRSIQHAGRIVQELHAARPLCPTYGPVLCLAGQLELLLLDKPQEGAGHVRLGRELSPNDPSAVFAAALVDVNEKQWDASLEKFRHCLALNSNTITDVLASYIGADRPDLGLAVSDGNAFWLLKLVVALRGDDKHADVTAQARDSFLALMAGEDQQNQATGWMLFEAGNLYRDRGDNDSAIAYYEKAVAKDYGQVPWRFELAKCLAASGKTSAAMREARLCLRLRPQWPAAKKFIEQLSLRPSSFVAAAKTGLATQPGATTQPDAATQPATATQPAPVREPGAAGAKTLRESAERETD